MSLPQSLPMSLSTCHIHLLSTYHCIQPVIVTNLSLSLIQNQILDHQEHLSTRCSNITKTCLYQACTNISYISSQDMISTMYEYIITIYVPYHVSTMYIKPVPCTKLCINHAPKLVPYHVSTMYINTCTMYQTVHQSCTNTYTIPCINHVPYHAPNLYHTINHVPPSTYTISLMICLNHPIHHVPKYTINKVSKIYQDTNICLQDMLLINVP
jgi:hypothetical protein